MFWNKKKETKMSAITNNEEIEHTVHQNELGIRTINRRLFNSGLFYRDGLDGFFDCELDVKQINGKLDLLIDHLNLEYQEKKTVGPSLKKKARARAKKASK